MKKEHIQGTSRRDEEKHLEETLAVVHSNMEEYGRQVREMQADIDEMLEHYHDNDVEVYTILCNTITMHDHMKQALMRNVKALASPYFGRIVYYDQSEARQESIYIGRGGIARDATHQQVVDWRAPVANAYYENGLGKCSYRAPDGKALDIDLKLKRTYEIKDGALQDYFDSEVISNDELLTKYLARSKQAVLGEIVATIQKEQNEIIRRSPYHNIIVQGVAGSGKTTVAMHRISFILYNYAERFRPEDFYIVGSNRILLNYITGVLPDLDVYGVRQMTMEQLFVRLLYEEWDEKKYRIRQGSGPGGQEKKKGGTEWFEELRGFCDRLERRLIPTGSVYLNPRQFVEGIQDGKNGVYDKSADGDPLILLLDGEAVERYLSQNPDVSIQNKINMLNERLLIKVRDELLGKDIKYTEEEKKAILKAFRNRYGKKKWEYPIFRLYEDFLREQNEKGAKVTIPGRELDVYDLAALAYLYRRTRETEVISEAHHIVIDEAQDFGMMIYRCLYACVRGCTYTVMGDVSQNIRFGMGLNDWEPLKELLLTDPMDHFDVLKKSYRNTVEISHFATNILLHGSFFPYPAEPLIRHGAEVRMQKSTEGRLFEDAARQCRDWQERGLATIAVVCRDESGARRAARELSRLTDLLETDPEKAEFGTGIMVLPVAYTKGLEFDAVLILNPTREDYPVDDGHTRLLYVAATRALHELCILYEDDLDLTGLIADPLPEREDAAGKAEEAGPKTKTEAKAEGKAQTEAKAETAAKAVLPQRPRARVVLKPVPSTATPEHAKPLTSYGAKPAPAAERKPEHTPVENAVALPAFGSTVPREKIPVPGHPKIDLSVRWVSKAEDGLRIQSRYGLLRLSPVGSGILRISFSGGGTLPEKAHPLIAVDKPYRFWTYREYGPSVELTTEELLVQIQKGTGCLKIFDRDKKPLFAQREREGIQLTAAEGGGSSGCRFYFTPGRKEHLFARDPMGREPLRLQDTARYLSRPAVPKASAAAKDLGSSLPFPFLYSDRGWGILTASEGPVFFCDLPSGGGPCLCAEGKEEMDLYFIAGRETRTLENACRYLCGML